MPGRRVIRRIGPAPEEVDGRTYWNATVVLFDGEVHVISRRAILTLVTIRGCNAACRFCSNEITFTTGGPYLRPDERVRRAVDLAELAGVTKIAYTGGEPTLNPAALRDLVAATADRFEKARLHTNGIGLLRPVPAPSGERLLVDALIEAGLTGVSLSVAHPDPAVNRMLMRFKTAWKGLSDEELRRIAERDGRGGFSGRLSCVLSPDGVADTQGVLDYVAWGRGVGFRKFIFRSPSGIPEPYTKPTEYAAFNADTYLDIHPIVERLAALDGWTETFAEHKSDSHVHVLRSPDGAQVTLDESSEEEDPDDKVRRLNVMPTGVLYTSWIEPYSYLFADDAARARRDAARELPGLRPAPAEGALPLATTR